MIMRELNVVNNKLARYLMNSKWETNTKILVRRLHIGGSEGEGPSWGRRRTEDLGAEPPQSSAIFVIFS